MESICSNCESRDLAHLIEKSARNREDVTLWGVDYMPYLLDADGEPIHVGDVMEWPDHYIAEVVGIGNDRFFYVDECLMYAWANDKIHYHAPTVEDVLREFAEKITDSQVPGVHPTYEEAISEYASKLRLADHAEA